MARKVMRSNVSRGTGNRRKFVWARQSGIGVLATGVTDKVNLLSVFETAYGAQLIGATIVRIRGVLAWQPTAESNTQAVFAAGVEPAVADETVTDGPFDMPFKDWMMYEPFLTFATDGGYKGTDVCARVVDVKAQRKIEEVNEQLAMFIESTGAAGSYSYHLSIGVKLS